MVGSIRPPFAGPLRRTVPARLPHLTVDRDQSKELDRALKAAGVESTLIMVEGATHAWPLKTAAFDHTGEVVAFFDRHLKAKR